MSHRRGSQTPNKQRSWVNSSTARRSSYPSKTDSQRSTKTGPLLNEPDTPAVHSAHSAHTKSRPQSSQSFRKENDRPEVNPRPQTCHRVRQQSSKEFKWESQTPEVNSASKPYCKSRRQSSEEFRKESGTPHGHSGHKTVTKSRPQSSGEFRNKSYKPEVNSGYKTHSVMRQQTPKEFKKESDGNSGSKTYHKTRRQSSEEFFKKGTASTDETSAASSSDTRPKRYFERGPPQSSEFKKGSDAVKTHSAAADKTSSTHPPGRGSKTPVKQKLKKENEITEGRIRQLEQIVHKMMKDGEVKRLPRNETELNKFFVEEVRLRRRGMEKASNAFGEFKDRMLTELNRRTPFKWSYLNDGSYYDGTKVKYADESDCLLIPDIRNIKAHYADAPDGFCYIAADSVQQSQQVDILDGNYLSAAKFREYVFHHLQSIMKLPEFTKWKRQDKYVKSPSFGVSYSDPDKGEHFDMDIVPALAVPKWPDHVDSLDCLEKEESNKIKEKGFHVVTKNKKNGRLWKMTFCQAEKTLTKHADKKLSRSDDERKTCRKEVMRILKRILEITKTKSSDTVPNENRVMENLQKAADYIRKEHPDLGVDFEVKTFSTYHLRTLMLRLFYKECSRTSMWQGESRSRRLCMALRQLQKWTTGQVEINNFLMPRVQVMKHVPREEREFIYLVASVAIRMFSDQRAEE